MKFLVSLINDATWIEQATPEDVQAMADQMNEYIDGLTDDGVYLSGEGLGPSADARTLRYGDDGKIVVTDGPFAESKEQVAGYMILECKEIDEAVDVVSKMPNAGGQGAAEVRAIFNSAAEVAEAYREVAAKS